ncbi:MAG TPA: hypothetical protein VMB26_06655 [Candidatus Binataceae bacterium]|nr:hypothetical protein [Candidatus Binataceae bacterium]
MKLLGAISVLTFIALGAMLFSASDAGAQITTGEYGTAIGTATGAANGTGTQIGGTAINGAHIEGFSRGVSDANGPHADGKTVIQEIPLDKPDARRIRGSDDWQQTTPH